MIRDVAAFTARLSELVEHHQGADAGELAGKLIGQIDPAAYRDLLRHFIEPEVEWRLRARARSTEQDARRRAQVEATKPLPPAASVEPEPEDFEKLYRDPSLWALGSGKPDRVWFNANRRNKFGSWCRKRDGRNGFDAWLDRALNAGVDEDFKMDWIPNYIHHQRTALVTKLIRDVADEVRFEVTAELLDTMFATGDGTRVSWGDATIAQHTERVDTLTKMIAGTSETAAMHIAAVRMCEGAGVDTLRQISIGDAEQGAA
ncbi:hypothetical protein [Mycobacterium marseillense]|uniref:Uncharacterized protein n=1 Tax=Mycobacterium marseillense TaxID=701042 RepID=A0ABM7JB49_9MYCO|nr:hypothetical protein [Mycobacterium marseillense]MCV7404508.1 hypothetical protein [Mycobacterium marseillense]ORA89777.1 hypothetical protein BST31_17535 [Mycobacterium marseillense]BBY11002.1 hypothetical protein MMARJ_17420 [Mycobacterium marseillense]